MGSTSFLVCTYLSLYKPWQGKVAVEQLIHPRQILASSTTAIWACYLGSFLFSRTWKHGDKRFDKVKKMPAKFLAYWTVQGVWVALTALPVYVTSEGEI